MSSGNFKIFEVSTVHGELLSSEESGEGNRGGVVPQYGELFHACIVPELGPDVKPLAHVFLCFL